MAVLLMFQRVMTVHHKFTNYLSQRSTGSFEKPMDAYLAKQCQP